MALEMKFGNDPKKTGFLVALGLLLVYLLYTNVFSTPEYASSAPAPKTTKTGPVAPISNIPAAVTAGRKKTQDRRAQEFRPRIGPARPEDRPDPMTVDPTLRLDLLARLERVQFTGGMRSLFDFSNVPSSAPVARIIPSPKNTPKPVVFVGPMPKPPDPPPPGAIPPPLAPPIPLKFYGFASAPKNANRRAFFLDGDEIVVASEGELIKRRYKVVRIGLTNVTMEDTQFKQQQTLPIVPDNIGGGF